MKKSSPVHTDTLFGRVYERLDSRNSPPLQTTLTGHVSNLALSLLIGGLAREANTSRRQAEALQTILDRGEEGTPDLLAYALAGKQDLVSACLSRSTDVSESQIHELLPYVADVLRDELAQIRTERNLSTDRIAALLNRERAQVEKSIPDVRRGILMDLFEYDDAGAITREVQKIWTGLTSGSRTHRLQSLF